MIFPSEIINFHSSETHYILMRSGFCIRCVADVWDLRRSLSN